MMLNNFDGDENIVTPATDEPVTPVTEETTAPEAPASDTSAEPQA